MKRTIALVVLAAWSVVAQNAEFGELTASGYTNSPLGFHYVPPATLALDQSAQARSDLQKLAAQTHRPVNTAILLRLLTGGADTSPDWVSLAVMTYSRASWADVDDFHAETRMNAAMARGASPAGENKPVTFGGVAFVASQFEMHEGAIAKHATVYSTVRRGQILSFAFSGNSAEAVSKDAESMKSLTFSGSN